MVILRNENGYTWAVGRMGEPPVHLKVAGDGSEALGKLSKGKIKIGGIELDSRQKEIGFLVSMLVGEQDVAVVAKDEVGNRGDDSFAVGAVDEKDGGSLHKGHCPLCTSVSPVVQELLYHRGHRGAQGYTEGNMNYFFSAFAISRAALAPEPPVSPVPGCVPLPHRYRRSIGV